MKTRNRILPLAAAMGSLALAATSANGAITTTDLGHKPVSGNNAAVIAVEPVGIGDLLESATTVNFTGGLAFGSQLKNANDGLAVSNGGSTGATGDLFAPNIGSTLEFVLDASYDIGQIDAFTLWNAPSDNRTAHAYSIDVSTDGGSNYSLLTGVSLSSAGATVQGPNIRGVSLTDDGGVLASGINAIRFTFNTVPDGLSPAVFAELDVYAVAGPDNDPPVISTLSPADDATGVAPITDLVATFDEAIALTGVGTITVTDTTDATGSFTIDLTSLPDSDAAVSVSGAELTIDPTTALEGGSGYAVQISADAIEDLAASPNGFAGILNNDDWNFTTVAPDTTAPEISTLSPADDATGVAPITDLVATFDEDIALTGVGTITVTDTTDDSSSFTIDLTSLPDPSAAVSVSGAELTIDPTTALEGGSGYAVQISADAIEDLSGNDFAGILNDDDWSLTTVATSPSLVITDLGHKPVSGNNAAVIAVEPVGIGDLLESATTVNFTGGLAFGSQLKNANDGLAVSNGGSTGATGDLFAPNIGSTLEFVLDASYDIGQIDAFTLWNAPSDNRTAHAYDIHVSTDGGSNYSLLAGVNLSGAGASVQGAHIRGVSLTDGGGVLASGINAIRFTFNTIPGPDLSPAVFAELDVYGVAGPGRITSFEGAGATGVINGAAKTIALEVPFGTDLATLAPTFTLNSGTCDQTSGALPSPTFAAQNPVDYVVTDTSTDPDTVNTYSVTVTVAPQIATLVIDLGTSPAGTTIEGGTFGTYVAAAGFPTNLPLPALPAGSILQSIELDTKLEATDNENWASDLAVLLDPTPGTPGGDFSVEITNGDNPFGATVPLGWPASADAGVGTELDDTKTDADWAAAAPIDLATTGLFLGNAHDDTPGPEGQGGTWSGTITLTYVVGSGGGNSFGTWIAGYDVGGQTGIGDDPDGDGVDSGVENFFGTAPDTFTQGLVSAGADTGAGTFTFTHPQTGTIADDLTATYQWSVDLDNFFADGVADGGVQVDFVATADTPSPGTTTVVATATGPIPEKLFVNVEVTQP